HDILNRRIQCIYEDAQHHIWIGTLFPANPLIRYDPESGELITWKSNTDLTAGIPAGEVYSIVQDNIGIIWIGSNAGLIRYDPIAHSFEAYTTKHGLANNHVAQLLVDDHHNIWMATNHGICMFDPLRKTFRCFDESDGLQGKEFNLQNAYITHDGYFCYAGMNGFNMFHPDSLKQNKYRPPIVMRSFKIFEKEMNIDSLLSTHTELHLSYKQNFFTFEFAALNYDHPEKNRYKFQLIGFDKKMIDAGTNRTISYTNVPAGDYVLKVIASNNDGVWNETGYELKLIITPPFWQTTWFRTIVVLAFIGVIFLLFRLRENRIRKEHERETAINKQIAEIRMTALRSQMNPHFIFNSLNAIQHFITTRDKEEALNYLSKFSKLIRQILENSGENTVSLADELQLIELYIQLEQLRFSDKFVYHISVDKKIDPENTEIPPLLIQPYVENAILHGLVNKDENGILQLSFERNNGMLICKVEDNGIGREKANEIRERKNAKHKSLGIKISNERLATLSELLDYKTEVVIEDLKNEDQKATGTKVTITMQMREEE
ncbi:MAG: histidine kinase, partial [Chitinophagales bacterium]